MSEVKQVIVFRHDLLKNLLAAIECIASGDKEAQRRLLDSI